MKHSPASFSPRISAASTKRRTSRGSDIRIVERTPTATNFEGFGTPSGFFLDEEFQAGKDRPFSKAKREQAISLSKTSDTSGRSDNGQRKKVLKSVDDLRDELLCKVFSFLARDSELAAIARVCKRWNNICVFLMRNSAHSRVEFRINSGDKEKDKSTVPAVKSDRGTKKRSSFNFNWLFGKSDAKPKRKSLLEPLISPVKEGRSKSRPPLHNGPRPELPRNVSRSIAKPIANGLMPKLKTNRKSGSPSDQSSAPSPVDARSYIQSYETRWWRSDQATIDARRPARKYAMLETKTNKRKVENVGSPSPQAKPVNAGPAPTPPLLDVPSYGDDVKTSSAEPSRSTSPKVQFRHSSTKADKMVFVRTLPGPPSHARASSKNSNGLRPKLSLSDDDSFDLPSSYGKAADNHILDTGSVKRAHRVSSVRTTPDRTRRDKRTLRSRITRQHLRRYTMDDAGKENYKDLAQVDRRFQELLKRRRVTLEQGSVRGSTASPRVFKRSRTDSVIRVRLVRQKSGHIRGDADDNQSEKFWKETVLPNWDALYRSAIVQHFWSKDGLPFGCRGIIWAKMIGNPVKVSKKSFQHYLKTPCEAGPMEAAEWFRDIQRMFQHKRGRAAAADMHLVLTAFYNFYHTRITYAQPLSYIVRMLLSWMEADQAFVSLVNLVQFEFMNIFVNMNVEGMQEKFQDFELILKRNVPGFMNHLGKLEIPVDTFLVDWVFTMFVKPLPLALACRIWDNFFLFGEIYLWKTCSGLILWLLKHHKLQTVGLDEAMRLLRSFPRPSGREYEELVETIAGVRVPHVLLKKFKKARIKDDALAQGHVFRKPTTDDGAPVLRVPSILMKPSSSNDRKTNPDLISSHSELHLDMRSSGFYNGLSDRISDFGGILDD